MTDYKSLSDSELTEALNFHRRQRNMSRGINEAAHMRQTQVVRLLEAEEVRRLDEAVTVDKKNYSWGKMMTVRHGSSHSFPLHPEHQEKIKNLKDGESTSFTDETRSKVTAKREGDKVHLSTGGAGHSKTTVAHSHFTEEVEQIDEISYRDSGAQNMMRASRKADKEADKMRAQQAKAAAKAAAKKVVTKEEVEINEANALGWSFKVTTKKHGPHDVTVSRSAAKSVDDAEQYIKKHPMYVKHKPTKIEYVKEEVEQIDEISTELKKRYVEKGGQDVVDRFTGRGKYERPHNPAHFTKTGRVKKSALNRPEAVKYREKLDNRRDIVNKVSQEVHGKKRFGEEFELDESKHYLVGMTGNNLTGHTSQPHFNSHDDAMSYQKKFKHVPAIKKAKIVKGTSDKHGFVTPVNEEVDLDEQTMPGNVALRLVDRHQAAAFHHKKNGNIKGFAAHFKVANRIEDAVIRAGRDMPVKSKQLEAASDKAFKEHPHHPNRTT